MAWKLDQSSGSSFDLFEMLSNLPVTNGLVHEFGSDSGIDAATDSSNYLTFWPTNLPNPRNFFRNE